MAEKTVYERVLSGAASGQTGAESRVTADVRQVGENGADVYSRREATDSYGLLLDAESVPTLLSVLYDRIEQIAREELQDRLKRIADESKKLAKEQAEAREKAEKEKQDRAANKTDGANADAKAEAAESEAAEKGKAVAGAGDAGKRAAGKTVGNAVTPGAVAMELSGLQKLETEAQKGKQRLEWLKKQLAQLRDGKTLVSAAELAAGDQADRHRPTKKPAEIPAGLLADSAWETLDVNASSVREGQRRETEDFLASIASEKEESTGASGSPQPEEEEKRKDPAPSPEEARRRKVQEAAALALRIGKFLQNRMGSESDPERPIDKEALRLAADRLDDLHEQLQQVAMPQEGRDIVGQLADVARVSTTAIWPLNQKMKDLAREKLDQMYIYEMQLQAQRNVREAFRAGLGLEKQNFLRELIRNLTEKDPEDEKKLSKEEEERRQELAIWSHVFQDEKEKKQYEDSARAMAAVSSQEWEEQQFLRGQEKPGENISAEEKKTLLAAHRYQKARRFLEIDALERAEIVFEPEYRQPAAREQKRELTRKFFRHLTGTDFDTCSLDEMMHAMNRITINTDGALNYFKVTGRYNAMKELSGRKREKAEKDLKNHLIESVESIRQNLCAAGDPNAKDKDGREQFVNLVMVADSLSGHLVPVVLPEAGLNRTGEEYNTNARGMIKILNDQVLAKAAGDLKKQRERLEAKIQEENQKAGAQAQASGNSAKRARAQSVQPAEAVPKERAGRVSIGLGELSGRGRSVSAGSGTHPKAAELSRSQTEPPVLKKKNP